MPNYKTHSRFNSFLAFPLALIAIYYFFHPNIKQLSLFSICFLYSSFFMSPDLDIRNKIKFFSFRGILSLPFFFYSILFKHRGLSHSLFFGSLSRIIYLTALAALIIYVFDIIHLNKKSFILFLDKNRIELIYIFIGIFIADLSHVFLDKIMKK
jgi:uncharacterized metal-binding protein